MFYAELRKNIKKIPSHTVYTQFKLVLLVNYKLSDKKSNYSTDKLINYYVNLTSAKDQQA